MAGILLIEPNQILAGQYETALEAAGHKVVHEKNAQAAISAADTNKPDLIIMELFLARHGGIEFLYELRSYPEWQEIPVIILSRIKNEGAMTPKLQRDLNIVETLYKPDVSLAKLVDKVNGFLTTV